MTTSAFTAATTPTNSLAIILHGTVPSRRQTFYALGTAPPTPEGPPPDRRVHPDLTGHTQSSRQAPGFVVSHYKNNNELGENQPPQKWTSWDPLHKIKKSDQRL
jgi:hypothetical protein